MPRRSTGPLPPRSAAPDLPRVLEDADGWRPHADLQQVRLAGLTGDVDLAHARLTECVVATASVDRLDLSGATLVDVEVEEPRATAIAAGSGRWRSVRVTGGRIGTLDLARAELEAVELRGVRIDYLALTQATVRDLLIVDCTIGTLDVPFARLERVSVEDSRADEVDTRELRAKDLDLRGLDALAYTDPTALRGATLSARQVAELADAFAAALGIDVRD
ncbi:pentapeptide repeat-containing protein [Microbacterium terricola]|nr:pentapeptide repeat-containing protein [Microbacterium terricola]UYK41459.1 pentapeptide repeat-containing protein [Microbacterium terricola]